MVSLILPWPPTVNTYWRRKGDRYFVSPAGKQYRELVHYLCHGQRNMFAKDDALSIVISAFPPDNRRRDLDNILKSLLDSLQHANVYHDDNQIEALYIRRYRPLKGELSIRITKEQDHQRDQQQE